MAEAFDGLLEFCQVVDDIIIYDKDKASHINHVRQFLQQYKMRHITLNKGEVQVQLHRSHLQGSSYLQKDARLIQL